MLRVLFIGDDWAEDHHDIEIEDADGRRLARARLPEGLEGITRLHALVAEHAPAAWAELLPEQVSAALIPRFAKSGCVLRFACRCARIRHVNREALRSQFLTDGYCCIENVVPAERVE